MGSAATVLGMRALLLTIARSWQPAAVVGGALLAIGGLTATCAQYLGVWPAVAACGALICAGGLLWGRLAVVEGE